MQPKQALVAERGAGLEVAKMDASPRLRQLADRHPPRARGHVRPGDDAVRGRIQPRLSISPAPKTLLVLTPAGVTVAGAVPPGPIADCRHGDRSSHDCMLPTRKPCVNRRSASGSCQPP